MTDFESEWKWQDEETPSKEHYYGRKIVDALIEDNLMKITFEDGVKIRIYDDGQSCCELRYMRTDDDVKTLIGGTLLKIFVKGVGEEKEKHEGKYFDDDYHEVAFLEIQTDKSFVTLSTHNEHNGYYGGFGLAVEEDK